jgi:eukaryotic-like serine/threonine-protein kinase
MKNSHTQFTASDLVDTCLYSEDGDASPAPSEAPFSVDEKYVIHSTLGQGASGLVFYATDTVLSRKVAIKFLVHNSPEYLPLLKAEATTQAAIEHKYVCPIYEVNEVNGSIYLVMQYADGALFGKLVKSLSVEQILLLVAKVATGLHAAHQKGVVHRDVKPNNILVVSSDAEGYEPLLIDFGLAFNSRDVAEGIIKGGTPRFMAPEQAKASTLTIDSRADIFALGATLYYALVGVVPPLVVPNEVTNFDDEQGRWQALPLDVKAIIQHCMAFDSDKRYPSARVLSEDIHAVLNGEPISIKGQLSYYLLKKLKKHRWLSLAAALVVLTVIGAYIKHNYEAVQQGIREQALVAFTDEVKSLEYDAQLTYMSPRHNFEQKKQEWLRVADKIMHESESLGPITQGAAHFAIGRIHYTLQDFNSAIFHLKKAQALHSDPQVGYYLALSLGAEYQHQLRKAQNIENPAAKASKIDALDNAFKLPAMALLADTESISPLNSYAKALLAFYSGETAKALTLLSSASDLPPWFYQDEVLLGDILLNSVDAQIEAGKNIKALQQDVMTAKQAYLQAAKLAPSDQTVQLKPIELELLLARAAIKGGKLPSDDHRQTTWAKFDEIAAIDQTKVEALLLFGHYARIIGSLEHDIGGNPKRWFERALDKLTQATKIDEHNSHSLYALALLYTAIIQDNIRHDLTPDKEFTLAREAFAKVPNLDKDYFYFNELATLIRQQANYDNAQGKDATAGYQEAVALYLEANRRFPQHTGSLINAASTLNVMSLKFTSEARLPVLDRALKILDGVLEQEPSNFVSNYYKAVFLTEKVKINLIQGKLIPANLDNARLQIEKTKQINNEHPYILDLALQFETRVVLADFTNTLKWHTEFDQLISKREQLLQKFPGNQLLVRNLVGNLTTISSIRKMMDLEMDTYLNKLRSILQNQPSFYSSSVFLVLFQALTHWGDFGADWQQMNKALGEAMQHDETYRWTKTIIMAHLIKSEAERQQVEQQLEDNVDLQPIVRQLFLQWLDDTADKHYKP